MFWGKELAALLLTIFVKNGSMVDVQLGSKYASDTT